MLERKATRYGYGEGLVILGEKNPRVVTIGLDTTSSIAMNMFQEKFPDRYFQLGVAEQNGMGVAAGLSLVGFIPYVCTYGVFASGRAWEQIRTTICYSDCNVKIGGGHGGITVGPDGATHQALEEIAIMRVIPNIKVLVPCDAIETRKATVAIADIPGPVYTRFGRTPVPVITDESTPFEVGHAHIWRKGKDVTLIGCGIMVYECLLGAEELDKEGISAAVLNVHTIKPIDDETIVHLARQTGAVVTAEEHQLFGGLGSAVCEVLGKNYPVAVEMVGVNDKFGESGEPDELLTSFGLTHKEIIEAARKVLKRK